MGKYLLPIEAEEIVSKDNHGNTIPTIYEITEIDKYTVLVNGKIMDLDCNSIRLMLRSHEYLEEIFETDVIAMRKGDSQLENKFIIDLFGELGCKFKNEVHDKIKNGYWCDQFLYGNIEKGTLFRSGSLQGIEDSGEDHETLNVEEIYLGDLIQRVRDKNRGQI